MGWAFMSSKHGRAWIRKEYDRGAWMYDGEADLGNGAAIRIAETILTDDPLFGLMAYGGILRENWNSYSVFPRDGLRCRFSVITEKNRWSIELDRDGFARDGEIVVGRSLKSMTFEVENRTGDSHNTGLTIFVPDGMKLKINIDGREVIPVKEADHTYRIDINISESKHTVRLSYS